nr:uncharacterized protein LOC129261516 [Lytechinus pictus]
MDPLFCIYEHEATKQDLLADKLDLDEERGYLYQNGTNRERESVGRCGDAVPPEYLAGEKHSRTDGWHKEEEDGAEEDRSITDDELEENDVEAPTELVGNFPPEDLEGPSTSSANGRKATGEKRKKSKLQESFGLIAKEIKTLEEDSTNAFNAREDRFMQRQMEWERELLMKAQRTEEKN